MKPIISVVIPVYNAEEYLEQCIESVIKQTIFQQIEIIAINDGSTDNSNSILNEYAKKYANIHVYHQENMGIANARKNGIHHASGQYIAMIDNDDFVEPTMYEKLLKESEMNNADYVYCNYSFFPQGVKYKQKWFKKYNGVIDWNFIERNTQPWNKLIRRDLVEKIDMVNRIEKYSDSIYLCALLHANTIICLDEPLYHYRVGHQSESGSYRGKMEYYIGVAERTRIQKDFLDTNELKQLDEYFEYRYIYSLIQLCCISALNEGRKVYDSTRDKLKELNYKKNSYTNKILVNNHGYIKAIILENIIPSNYHIAKFISKHVF